MAGGSGNCTRKGGSMLRIWGRENSSNVRKVLWCCGELDIAFERIDIGGARFGGLDSPEYLALNPNHAIPTIEDWSSPGFVDS
jgi:glutathione S-transferase